MNGAPGGGHPPARAQVPQLFYLSIGVGDYEKVESPHRPCKSDAYSVAEALGELGYTGELMINPTRQHIKDGLARFYRVLSQQLKPISLFFFSGHAIQVDGETLLVPSETPLIPKEKMRGCTIPLSWVQAALHDGGCEASIMVIDSPSTTPYSSKWGYSLAIGLAPIIPEPRTLVYYSHLPGREVGSDLVSGGERSLFVRTLLKHLLKHRQTILTSLLRTTEEVSVVTNGLQLPWTTHCLMTDVVVATKATRIVLDEVVTEGDGEMKALSSKLSNSFNTADYRKALAGEAHQRESVLDELDVEWKTNLSVYTAVQEDENEMENEEINALTSQEELIQTAAAMVKKKDTKSAKALFKKALSQAQQNPVLTYLEYAKFLRSQNKVAKADSYLEKLFAINGTHAEGLYLKSQMHREKGELDQCKTALETLIDCHPTYVEGLLALSQMHLTTLEKARVDGKEMDEVEKERLVSLVEDHLLTAIRQEPRNADCLAAAATLFLVYRTDKIAAESYFQRAIDSNPNNVYVLTQFAWFLWQTRGDQASALSFLKEALIVDPNFSPALRKHAWLSYHAGDYDTAFHHYQRAVINDPHDAHVRTNYGVLLEKIRKDYPLAEEQFLIAIDCDPEYFPALVSYGLLQSQYRGDKTKALQCFQSALKVNPDYIPALLALAQVSAEIGHREEAANYFERAVALDGDNPDVLLKYALFLKNSDPGQTKFYCKKLLDIDPTNEGGLELMNYLVAQQAVGVFAGAQREKQAGKKPALMRSLSNLGEKLMKKGRNTSRP